MTKFHINPKTGNPGKCSAEQGKCPFGSDSPHFSTEEDARQAFELSQGASFGINAPLLTANKTVIKDLIESMDSRNDWVWGTKPDSEVFDSARRRLRTIAEIGFSTKSSREESSKQIQKLADEVYKARNSETFAEALGARRAYSHLIAHLEKHKLEDLRTEDEREIDNFVKQYNLSEQREGYGDFSTAELDNIERIATSVPLADMTSEDIAVTKKASFHARTFEIFHEYDVNKSKRVKSLRATAEEFDSLPPHVQEALGSKEDLLKEVEKIEKETEMSNKRKEQMARFVTEEKTRRQNNAEIEALLSPS